MCLKMTYGWESISKSSCCILPNKFSWCSAGITGVIFVRDTYLINTNGSYQIPCLLDALGPACFIVLPQTSLPVLSFLTATLSCPLWHLTYFILLQSSCLAFLLVVCFIFFIFSQACISTLLLLPNKDKLHFWHNLGNACIEPKPQRTNLVFQPENQGDSSHLLAMAAIPLLFCYLG